MDKTFLKIVIEVLQEIGAVFVVKDSEPPDAKQDLHQQPAMEEKQKAG